MNWSLKIPLHLKRVATLPCETLMFKNLSKSTLINICCSLSYAFKLDYCIFRHLKQFGYNTLQYHIIFDLFCWSFFSTSCVCPKFCALFAATSPKVQ